MNVIIPRVPIVTSAPTRIDLAGGTIDIWPLYLFHPGAQTLNAAISIRARATRRVARRHAHRDSLGGYRRHRRSRRLARALRDERGAAAAVAARALLRGARHHADHVVTSRRPAPALPGRRRSTSPSARRSPSGSAPTTSPEALLQVAMNVEAQAISVPTGPAGLPAGALRRHRRAGARGRRHPPRAARCRHRRAANSASCSATPASRATPAPTTGRSPRGISTATATSSTASSASATRPRTMRDALAARRLGRGRRRPSPASGRTGSSWRPA